MHCVLHSELYAYRRDAYRRAGERLSTARTVDARPHEPRRPSGRPRGENLCAETLPMTKVGGRTQSVCTAAGLCNTCSMSGARVRVPRGARAARRARRVSLTLLPLPRAPQAAAGRRRVQRRQVQRQPQPSRPQPCAQKKERRADRAGARSAPVYSNPVERARDPPLKTRAHAAQQCTR